MPYNRQAEKLQYRRRDIRRALISLVIWATICLVINSAQVVDYHHNYTKTEQQQ